MGLKAQFYGKILADAPDELEHYLDERAEECGNCLCLLAKLRQLAGLSTGSSAGREELKTQLYASLSHIEVYSQELQLRDWWNQLDLDEVPLDSDEN